MTPPKNDRREQTALAVAHFVGLMHAYERGDLKTAADEQAILEQLGIRVRITAPKAVAS